MRAALDDQAIEYLVEARRLELEEFRLQQYGIHDVTVERVIAGEVDALLPEPPVAWAMTRGTTRGTPKRIPITVGSQIINEHT